MKQPADIFQKHIKQKIWQNSLVIAFITFLLMIVFSSTIDKDFSFLQISKALAGTSALMFAASFSLSGFCYWWDFLDTKIGYRKYLGLIAYWLAVTYGLSLLIINPDKYLFHLTDNLFTADVLLGGISMFIFTFIAIISRDKIMLAMGPHKWRYTLRLGYLAWLLLALRAWFVEKELWLEYIESFSGFPPPRLLLSLLVIAVIAFRISIDISKKCIPFTNKKIK
jgi:DMSO/TMAO reductase YedYZ heme-binding membrane subunit